MQSLSHSSHSRRNSLSSLHCSLLLLQVRASQPRLRMVHLTATIHGRALLIGGDTLPAIIDLKALSGRWNPTLRGWVFQGSRTNEVLTDLRAIHDVTTDRKVAWVSTGKTTAQPVDAKVKAKHADAVAEPHGSAGLTSEKAAMKKTSCKKPSKKRGRDD